MSKKKAAKDDPAGPEQVQGGVQPADAKPLTKEDHGDYAGEVSRQNGLEAPTDEVLAAHDDTHGGKGRHDDATEAAGRGVETFHGNLLVERERLKGGEKTPEQHEAELQQFERSGAGTPGDTPIFAANEDGAPVGVLAGYDAEYQRPDYLGLSRENPGVPDISTAAPEHRANAAADRDALKAKIEEIAKKNLDEKRGEGELPAELEPERHKIERQWYEQQKATLRERAARIESRRTIPIPNVGAVFAPAIGDTILVYLAAHCSFRRKPVPVNVLAAAGTEEQAAAAANTVRILEPLPAMVTHVDEDGFQVEVFGARAQVHETFRYTDYAKDGETFSGTWRWQHR